MLRTPTRAEGGITPEEKKQLDEHAKLWISRIMRTDPIEPEKITPAIEKLYEVSGLKKPRVVIVPSPRIAAFSAGLAASIWYLRENGKPTHTATRTATDVTTRLATSTTTRTAIRAAIDDATDATTSLATHTATRTAIRAAISAATRDAIGVTTYDATDDATYAATDDATSTTTRAATSAAVDTATDDATSAAIRDAIRDATDDAIDTATSAATDDATYAATSAATDDATYAAIKTHWLKRLAQQLTPNAVELSIDCVKMSWRMYQGGNMWGQYDSYLSAMRDVIGLKGLDCWEKFQPWEDAAIHGSWRYMHKEFCIVSDFPEILAVDEQNRPHSITGPSHRWRDGWELYHINGVKFEKELWQRVTSGNLTAKELAEIDDVDQRKIAMTFLSGEDFIREMKAELVDTGVTQYFAHTKNRGIHRSTRKTEHAVSNKLYKISEGDIYDEDKYFLYYENPSTDEMHISFVTNFVKEVGEDADAAMACKHGTDKDSFMRGQGA